MVFKLKALAPSFNLGDSVITYSWYVKNLDATFDSSLSKTKINNVTLAITVFLSSLVMFVFASLEHLLLLASTIATLYSLTHQPAQIVKKYAARLPFYSNKSIPITLIFCELHCFLLNFVFA